MKKMMREMKRGFACFLALTLCISMLDRTTLISIAAEGEKQAAEAEKTESPAAEAGQMTTETGTGESAEASASRGGQ